MKYNIKLQHIIYYINYFRKIYKDYKLKLKYITKLNLHKYLFKSTKINKVNTLYQL